MESISVKAKYLLYTSFSALTNLDTFTLRLILISTQDKLWNIRDFFKTFLVMREQLSRLARLCNQASSISGVASICKSEEIASVALNAHSVVTSHFIVARCFVEDLLIDSRRKSSTKRQVKERTGAPIEITTADTTPINNLRNTKYRPHRTRRRVPDSLTQRLRRIISKLKRANKARN
ncbi:hypothetical protein RF11_02918 [Thelohanellus kitauei]|uniref:Uncharacterized protein n=1 Tax=Thelohanellus kitauei TaxID=669202 RepID=A0A0C2J0P4_THEKT|nr:hypothetical protein RF11_02918 [Thelohanellus kitauei]